MRHANKTAIDETIGILLCSVSLGPKKPDGRNWDLFGNPPDPKIDLSIQNRNYGSVREADTFEAFGTWPGLSLQRGQSVEIRVTDIDLRLHDYAGYDTKPFEGTFPLLLKDEFISADCNGISLKKSEQLAIPIIRRGLDRADRDKSSPVDHLKDGWGLSKKEIASTREILVESASLLGWMHPWIGGLVSYHERALKEFSKKVQVDMSNRKEQTPSSIESQSLSVRWVSQRCQEDFCQVEIEFQAKENINVDFSSDSFPFSGWGVFSDGSDQVLSVQEVLTSGKEDSNVTLKPSETMRVLYQVSNEEGHRELSFLRGSWSSGARYLLAPENKPQ